MHELDAAAAANLNVGATPRNFWGWMGHGFFAVADQGLFAGSNFLLNVLLARWLGFAEYGIFAVAFSVFLLFNAVHQSLVIDPMLVFGPGRHQHRLHAYLASLIHGHIFITSIMSLLLLVAGGICWFGGFMSLALAILSWSIALPCILFLWLMRRACYVHGMPARAARAGGLYVMITLGSMFMLHREGWLSVGTAIITMALSSVIAGASICSGLSLHPLSASLDFDGLAQITREHWRYGRWSLSSGLVSTAADQMPYLALSIVGGTLACGTLRALCNLTMPLLQITAALSVLLMPHFVHCRNAGTLGKTLNRTIILSLSCSIPFLLLLGFGSTHALALLQWIYDKPVDVNPNVLWFLGLIPVFCGTATYLQAMVNACERPDTVFHATLLSAVLGASLIVVLTFTAHLPGTILSMALFGGIVLLTTGYLARHLLRDRVATFQAAHKSPADGEASCTLQ